MQTLHFKQVSTFVPLFIFVFFVTKTKAEPTYVFSRCSNTTKFTEKGNYHNNLKTLLSSLSSPNSPYGTGFLNQTVGDPPDRTYGLFLCRGDMSAEDCRDCVVFAVSDTIARCLVQKEAVIWYDQCMFRYSNRNIFSMAEIRPYATITSGENVTTISEVDSLDELMSSVMRKARSKACASPRRYGTQQGNRTAFRSMYGLAQCTPDLSSQDCCSCLRQAINLTQLCCAAYTGARTLTPSCYVRFEVYPFYNVSVSPSPQPSYPFYKLSVSPSPQPSLLPSPVPPHKGKANNAWLLIVAIVVPVVIAVILKKYGFGDENNDNVTDNAGQEILAADSLQFDFSTIEAATDKFSDSNKLGEGGFGAVYQGRLISGEEIAVKRLSKGSGQGVVEFKNEIVLVAKLQHKNLVKLLGFCVQGEEKLLVYEFVPNKSLDYFLYDPEKRRLLDWPSRYKIIVGIARGMLYLHQDSRLQIIHRDLKAGNILLDGDMLPKIADFGMARIFGGDQTHGNTSRIVGTYGYMAPEYAMQGQFSVKSDVYSFGVLVLGILSGKKNNRFCQTNGAEDLISYAWKLWKDGTPTQLLDSTLANSFSENEVCRCVHIGLLCVQQDPEDRPTMATIVLMLNSDTVTLPLPEDPGFFIGSKVEKNITYKGLESEMPTTSKSMQSSTYEVSITELYPR